MLVTTLAKTGSSMMVSQVNWPCMTDALVNPSISLWPLVRHTCWNWFTLLMTRFTHVRQDLTLWLPSNLLVVKPSKVVSALEKWKCGLWKLLVQPIFSKNCSQLSLTTWLGVTKRWMRLLRDMQFLVLVRLSRSRYWCASFSLSVWMCQFTNSLRMAVTKILK